MAKQTKSITCLPGTENEQMEIWGTFGWEVLSTQEVRDTESHLEQGWGDTINSVTTTTNYIRLTFSRDPAQVPHYAELKKLEDQFNAVPYPGDEPQGDGILKIFLGFMLCTIPGVYFLIRTINAARTRPQWRKEFDAYLAKRRAIYDQAVAIANS